MRKIYMIGDSTMQFNNINAYPQTGWGQVVNLFTKPDVLVIDKAVNGRSTKSFIEEGRFDEVLEQIEEGDFLICQFGHNDEKISDPARYTDPNTTYQENLLYFYQEITKKKAGFVLATSISRRIFENGKCLDTHLGYPQAMLEFANKYNITCIDLNTLTKDFYDLIGEEKTKKYHMIFAPNMFPNYMNGKEDNSHLRYEGAVMVAELFVKNLAKTNSPLNDLFIDLNIKEEIDYKMLID